MNIQELKEKIESLDPKVHRSLIDALTKEYKRLIGSQDQINPLSLQYDSTTDPFWEAFKKANHELNKHYIEGTLDHIRKRHPDLYQKINEVEARIDEIWESGLKGNTTLEEFKEVLEEWYSLYIKGIEIYKSEKGYRVKEF